MPTYTLSLSLRVVSVGWCKLKLSLYMTIPYLTPMVFCLTSITAETHKSSAMGILCTFS